MTDSNGTIKYRVTQLEKRNDHLNNKITKVGETMNTIRINDLPHLHEAMSSLKTRVNVATVFNVGAILLAAALIKFL